MAAGASTRGGPDSDFEMISGHHFGGPFGHHGFSIVFVGLVSRSLFESRSTLGALKNKSRIEGVATKNTSQTSSCYDSGAVCLCFSQVWGEVFPDFLLPEDRLED